MTNPLPAHSSRGASSAERWMACPGSCTLIEALQTSGHEDHDDPEWRRDGVQAHELASACLNADQDTWEADPETYPLLTLDMMKAVQVHLNYVRSRPGWQFVELKMHRPEFHEMMFGTTDVAVLDPDHLEVIDYKHGVGVVVEVEENPQLMYYAFMVIDELGSSWDDDAPITLTIIQPRVEWRDPVRSWRTTVGFIRRWAKLELHPAIQRTYVDAYLSPGEHCRFCPAKLLCPAFLVVANRAAKVDLQILKDLAAPVLSQIMENVPLLAMASKAIKAEVHRRIIHQRTLLPGWKVVKARANRVWKEGVDTAMHAVFGRVLFKPEEVKSPAQVEDEAGGKAFVAEWAYAPDGGYDIVHESDRRRAIVIEGPERWAVFVDNLKKSD
jgi:hypothetical protein